MKDKGNNYIAKILNRIWIAVLIIAIMTSINTITLISNNSLLNANKNNENQETNEDYDVSTFKEVSASELVDNTKDANKVVYIGRASCGWCVKFVPVLREAAEKYNLEIIYIDIAKIIDFNAGSIIDQKNYDIMMNLETVSDLKDYMNEEFGATPMVLIMKDGKIIDATTGYQESSSFNSFLEENDF